MNLWVWAHPGLVLEEPPQWDERGSAAPPWVRRCPGSPGRLQSQTDGAELTVQSSDLLKPLGIVSPRGPRVSTTPPHLLAPRISNGASNPADTLIKPAGGQALLEELCKV